MIRSNFGVDPGKIGLDAFQMSGWLFMAGDDEDDSGGIFSLGQVLQHDPSIIPYLDRPAPCQLVRDDSGDGFHEVEYDDEDDEDLDFEDFDDDQYDEFEAGGQ